MFIFDFVIKGVNVIYIVVFFGFDVFVYNVEMVERCMLFV